MNIIGLPCLVVLNAGGRPHQTPRPKVVLELEIHMTQWSLHVATALSEALFVVRRRAYPEQRRM